MVVAVAVLGGAVTKIAVALLIPNRKRSCWASTM